LLLVILALTPCAQSFWFLQAWRVIETVDWPGPRALLQGLWIVALLVVLAAALDLLGGRVLLRRRLGPWGWVAAILWIGWQLSRGLGGNLPMDWVAGIRGICR
jgi:hypothetical protein